MDDAASGHHNGQVGPPPLISADGHKHDGVAPALEARGLSAGYGSKPVIHELNLVVNPGEVVGLLGANGAGKTTTLLALSGELPLLGGTVQLAGRSTKSPLHRRARNGLAFVTEERSIFKSLSTMDNLRVGTHDCDAALALFPELKSRLGVRAGLLSGGEQQMLTLGRALSRQPRILLADELSLGLAPMIVRHLLEAVRRAAADTGCGVLLVEQHVRQALRYCDRVYVMRRGRVALEGTAAEMIPRLAEIEESYLAAATG
jgi:branched-chain amino acid transport system ATP-binding protein